MNRLIISLVVALPIVACSKHEASAPKSTTPTTHTNTSAEDTAVAQRVRQALMDDTVLAPVAPNVTVTSLNGAVTLAGNVSTADQKQKVEDKARGVSGVSSVVNKLQVKL